MNIVDTQNDFNLAALGFGGFLLLLCLVVQIVILHYASVASRRLRKRWLRPTPRRATKVDFVSGTVLLLLIHLLHIYMWGYALYFAGLVSALNAAVIFAGSTYTTLGFSSVSLQPSWQLVTIILGTSGLFSFGLSTSIMFILGQKVYDEEAK